MTGGISGDQFPNAEMFIIDSKGTSVLLSHYETDGGARLGPFEMLPGDFNDPMASFNVTAPVDMETGSFDTTGEHGTMEFSHRQTH